MVDDLTQNSVKENASPEDESPQTTPEEEKKRQIWILIGLVVLLGVIVVYQMMRLKSVKEEELRKGQYSQRPFLLLVGKDKSSAVKYGPSTRADAPISIVEEVDNPAKRHIVWKYRGSIPVSLEFLPADEVMAGTKAVKFLSPLTGMLEWTEGEVRTVGIPDWYGGYYDVTRTNIDPNYFMVIFDSIPALSRPAFVNADKAISEKVLGLETVDAFSALQRNPAVPDTAPSTVNSVTEVAYIEDNHRVLGVSYNGIDKAYPVTVLNYHTTVNDVFGDAGVLISYSPFAGVGTAYVHNISDATAPFTRTNLIYNGCELLTDVETGSLWSTMTGVCLSGKRKDDALKPIALVQTTWKDWRASHEETLVLSSKTGYGATLDDRNGCPYGVDQVRGQPGQEGYFDVENTLVPIVLPDGKFAPAKEPITEGIGNKSWVVGVRGGKPTAYSIANLAQLGGSPQTVTFGDTTLRIDFSADSMTGYASDPVRGAPLPEAVLCVWYVWKAHYPDTELH